MSAWSEQSLALIERLWKDGKSASEIAAALEKGGIRKTRNAVIGKLHRHGLTSSSRTFQRPQRVTKFYDKAKPKRVPRPPAPPKPKEVKAAAIARPVLSMNARPYCDAREGCKWLLGERGAYVACCNPIARGAYCAGHARLAYIPLSDQQKSERGIARAVSWMTRFERAA